MNKELFRMILGSLLRQGLTILSTYMVSHELLKPEYTNTFVENMTTYALDAIPAILALAWSLVQKARAHKELTQVTAVAVAAAADCPPPVRKYWC
jgi:uncharacterized membrane protein YfbV (UPF0208 family)